MADTGIHEARRNEFAMTRAGTNLIDWLRQEADDCAPEDDLYADSQGFRSPRGARLREAADEIERLRGALWRSGVEEFL